MAAVRGRGRRAPSASDAEGCVNPGEYGNENCRCRGQEKVGQKQMVGMHVLGGARVLLTQTGVLVAGVRGRGRRGGGVFLHPSILEAI